MAASLCNHSCACIHQNNCQICRRAAGNHITGVLLMSRSVRNDKFTSIGGEVAISHINCNTLFAFSLQSIEQQCIVDMLTCISYTLLSRSSASNWSSYNFLLSNSKRPINVDFRHPPNRLSTASASLSVHLCPEKPLYLIYYLPSLITIKSILHVSSVPYSRPDQSQSHESSVHSW